MNIIGFSNQKVHATILTETITIGGMLKEESQRHAIVFLMLIAMHGGMIQQPMLTIYIIFRASNLTLIGKTQSCGRRFKIS